MNLGFTSASGNLGKSTITINFILSLLAIKNTNNLKVCDCDERMTTLSDVFKLRKSNDLTSVGVYTKQQDIYQILEDRKSFNIFDLKGHLGEKEGYILNRLDLVVVITNNEKLVATKTLKYVKTLEQVGIKYIVLVNQFKDDCLSYEDMRKLFGVHLMENYIKEKNSYRKIDDNGACVYDKILARIPGLIFSRGAKSTKQEIEDVRDELLTLCKVK